MRNRIVPVLGIALICLCQASCTKLPETRTYEETLQVLAVELTDTIPAEYGQLVDVTSSSEYPGWAQLWFVREDQTITCVALNFVHGYVRQKITVIPRS